MNTTLKRTALFLGLAGAFALSACGSETSEPEAQDTGGPRSIFQDDVAEGPEGASLPPLETVLSFADGTSELTQAVRAELATIIDSPQVEAGGAITLRGHTDSEGADEENLEASRAHADAVRDFLVANGIDAGRITVIAFGEQNPVAPNALPDGSPDEEGRAANRRVELVVETQRSGERQQTLIETLTEDSEEAEVPSAAAPTPTPAQ